MPLTIWHFSSMIPSKIKEQESVISQGGIVKLMSNGRTPLVIRAVFSYN
ncbi:hypothetical protein N644_1872 [Lactiplantibacillus paraplantarum]|nr:hypothetical protein N644_1872 [Lactiplantibacillus paraplantarum]